MEQISTYVLIKSLLQFLLWIIFIESVMQILDEEILFNMRYT